MKEENKKKTGEKPANGNKKAKSGSKNKKKSDNKKTPSSTVPAVVTVSTSAPKSRPKKKVLTEVAVSSASAEPVPVPISNAKPGSSAHGMKPLTVPKKNETKQIRILQRPSKQNNQSNTSATVLDGNKNEEKNKDGHYGGSSNKTRQRNNDDGTQRASSNDASDDRWPQKNNFENGRNWKDNYESDWNQGIDKEALAVKNQRNSYYFSDNPGQAPSLDDFQKAIQFETSNFPLKQNETILINKKYDLMISSTSQKCEALYIRVRPQKFDDNTTPTAALLAKESTEEEIRAACYECIENLDIAKGNNRRNERSPISKASRNYLRSRYINEMTSPPEAFPESIYYCLKCDFHINSVSHAKTHLELSNHFEDVLVGSMTRRWETRKPKVDLQRHEQRINLLKKVPAPKVAQLRAIKKVLKAELEKYKPTVKIDKDTISSVILFLKTNLFAALGFPSVELESFGSATYNTTLPDSDLNVAFMIPGVETCELYELLGKIVLELEKEGMKAELTTTPSNAVLFHYMDVPVRLSWRSNTICQQQMCLSKLMQTYVSLRPEVAEFMQLIRLWAKVIGLDSKNKQQVGLPRYGFDIMAIHFLQQSDMIPVLHELEGDEEEDHSESTDVNHDESFTSENSRLFVPEEARERRIRVYSKYLDNKEKIKELFDLKKEWILGKLWIDFFKFYVRKNRDAVIQITQKKNMTKEMTKWNRKTLHIVDPFRGDNVLSLSKVSSFLPFFFNSLLATYVYFAIPRTEAGPLVAVDLHQNKVASTNKKKVKGTTTDQNFKTRDKKREPISVEKSIFDVGNYPESDWDAVQQEAIEEQEIEERSRKIASKLEFDGIRLDQLQADDVEIDEHFNKIYSRRTLMRAHRKYGYPKSLEIAMVDMLKTCSLTKLKSNRKEAQQETPHWFQFLKSDSRRLQRLKRAQNKNASIVPPVSASIEVNSLEAVEEVKEETELVAKTDVENTVIQRRSETPPAHQMWAYWNQTELDRDLEKVQQSGEVVLKEKSTEVLMKNGFSSEKNDFEKTNNEPSTSSKPFYDFGEFPGSSTFVGSKADNVRPVDDHICYEEFFIRELAPDFLATLNTMDEMCSEDYFYSFDGKSMTRGYEMETKCASCDGHHPTDKCPLMEVPPIESITKPLSTTHLKELDDVISNYYKHFSISTDRLKLLEIEVEKLQECLREKYEPDVVLTVFGSVMTGIGLNGSDVDICLRFDNTDKPPRDIDPVDVIIDVAAALRKSKCAKNVIPITTAKVPIVKFKLKLGADTVVDADISYYNILALYNTKLVRQYTTWTPDNRFAKLGLFVKHWAKHCDIGDASKGSISSYAHVIMLISYLQQCDPPVLPRLQESFRDENVKKRKIENWDTYFYEAGGNGDVQKKWAKNKQSCAELLIGFFDYYSNFGYKNFVIQCRREVPLSKMEKDWSRPLCIEDPFDLHHNLGSGVTKKMFAFIHRTFICSREVFMKPDVREKMLPDPDFNDLYRIALLNACSQGHAPTDRQCHVCGRIGHYVENCPKRTSKQDGGRKQRFSSGSTNLNFRSRGGGGDNDRNKKVEPGNIEYFKRPFGRR